MVSFWIKHTFYSQLKKNLHQNKQNEESYLEKRKYLKLIYKSVDLGVILDANCFPGNL